MSQPKSSKPKGGEPGPSSTKDSVNPWPPAGTPLSLCAIDGCDNKAKRFQVYRGLCGKHYTRWYRHGDPLHAAYSHTDEERIEHYIQRSEGCWLWTGSINSTGYGQTRFRGRQTSAHRAVYEIHLGAIPAGLDLDHLCRTRHCVNPDHLEPVTRGENIRRSPIVTHPSQADRLNKR